MNERLYDVDAVCLDDEDSGDGAYDLICRAATPEEIAKALQSVLSDDWGLTNPTGAVRLEITIRPCQ